MAIVVGEKALVSVSASVPVARESVRAIASMATKCVLAVCRRVACVIADEALVDVTEQNI